MKLDELQLVNWDNELGALTLDPGIDQSTISHLEAEAINCRTSWW